MKNDSSLIQSIETALSRSIGSMAGKEFRVSAGDQPIGQAPEEAILWQQQFSLLPDPCFWIESGKDLWQALGRATLEAAGLVEISDDDCRSTWQEILSQTAGSLATVLTAECGIEVTVSAGMILDAEPRPPLDWRTFNITEGASCWTIRVAWSAELAGAAAKPAASVPVKEIAVSRTFNLLLELALPVAVSFGKTSLQIREVLKLNTGSIVELDRFITDPVEVIVNNCVIARGEVVVVDGNYGVRINHLASREERLRTGMAEMARKGAR